MFIGPKGILTIRASGRSVAPERNPVFALEQVLIDDKPARLRDGYRKLRRAQIDGNPLQPEVTGNTTQLEEIFCHPELFAIYPHLKRLPVVNSTDLPSRKDWAKEFAGSGAAYISGNGKSNLIALDFVSLEKYRHDPQTTILHEIQHAIQDHEGYFSGPPIPPVPNEDEEKALYYAFPQEREALNIESLLLGGKKIWYNESNLKCAGYPKRIKINEWSARRLEFMEWFLKTEMQKTMFRHSLDIKMMKLRSLSDS